MRTYLLLAVVSIVILGCGPKQPTGPPIQLYAAAADMWLATDQAYVDKSPLSAPAKFARIRANDEMAIVRQKPDEPYVAILVPRISASGWIKPEQLETHFRKSRLVDPSEPAR